MTVEANPGEELENKQVPPQEEEEEEEEEPGVTPGAGEFLGSDMAYFSYHCGFCKQTAQRKRRKRRSPRRRKQPNLTLQGSVFRNSFQAECIRPGRFASIKTSEQNSDLASRPYPWCAVSNSWRTTSEEKRHDERMAMEDPDVTYNNIRRAAEVHRQVRQAARKFIRPGQSMTEIAEYIENGTRALVEENGLECGVGFPTGLSLNNCAAHYSPNAGDTIGRFTMQSQSMISQRYTVLAWRDVLKVDFGVHVNGRIVDSAFTLTWDHTYEKLLEAVQAATNTGVRVSCSTQHSGSTGRLPYPRNPASTYGSAMSQPPSRKPWNPTKSRSGERSYPVGPNHTLALGSTNRFPVKPISNLSGHSINRYQIHGGKSVQLVKNNDQTKMEEGEYFAIETFGSTGRGHVVEAGECSHYAKVADAPRVPLR